MLQSSTTVASIGYREIPKWEDASHLSDDWTITSWDSASNILGEVEVDQTEGREFR